jgi:hypothetical protein
MIRLALAACLSSARVATQILSESERRMRTMP